MEEKKNEQHDLRSNELKVSIKNLTRHLKLNAINWTHTQISTLNTFFTYAFYQAVSKQAKTTIDIDNSWD